MLSLASLLNPLPPSEERYCDSCFSAPPAQDPGTPPPTKKLKMSKSTATFVKAKPKGQVNYEPCEIQDDMLRAEHQKFQVEPVGQIREHPRHIPYNSEKKTFQERTGRDAFEAFHYTFRMPDDDHKKDPHVVMWDYNVGLVRITSFFKSLKHSKTMPAKVMNANPGLKNISHSITGGSIGYWIPYEAAKAIAATFCWPIRHVLTPVFGLEFPGMCVEPDDPLFLRMSIDKDIVLRCTGMANADLVRSQEGSMAGSPRIPYLAIAPKSIRPNPAAGPRYEGGYCTDTERSFQGSPESGSIEWTPVNIPRSIRTRHLIAPTSTLNTSPVFSSELISSSPQRTTRATKRAHHELQVSSGKASSEDLSSSNGPTPAKKVKTAETTAEVEKARAAYALMCLYNADVEGAPTASCSRRRASC